MRENIEDLMTYLWPIVRHRWIALLGATLICVIGWTVVHVLPNRYVVSTQIYLDPETVLRPLLRGLAVDNTATSQEIALLIRHTLLMQPALEELVQKTGLPRTTIGVEVPNILVEQVRFSDNRKSENVFQISYQGTDPDTGKRIVDGLMKVFIERVLAARRKDTIQAQKFLDQQIKEFSAKLEAAEDALKQFKTKHAGEMPEDGKTYFSRINGLQAQLDESRLALRETEQRISAIRQEMAAIIVAARSNQGAITVKTPLDIRIEELESKLDDLLLNYTEKHPDVISTRRVLAELYKKREAQNQILTADGSSKVDNAVLETKAYQDLKLLLSTAEGQAAALRMRISEYTQRIAELKSSSEIIPKVEAELAKLTQDYNTIKTIHDELLARRQAARISQEAEESLDETKFKIIKPANIPQVPEGPDRLLLATLVMGGGIVGGPLLTFLYTLPNPAFYTKRQVSKTLGLPVLGSVSMHWVSSGSWKRHLHNGLFLLLVIGLFLSYSIFLLHHGLSLESL